MGSTILFPVTNHRRWTRAVVEVIADVEGDATVVVLDAITDAADEDGPRDEQVRDSVASRTPGVRAATEALRETQLDGDIRGVVAGDGEADAVLSVVDESAADRVYMFARTRTPTGKAVYGSVLQQVLARSPVPVVVVPATAV